jgi:VWFA-related protein
MSTSMSPHMTRAQEAAIGLARTLRSGDRAMVLGFHDRVDVLQPLGDRIPEAIDAVRRTRAYGGTALYNALYIAMSTLTAERERSREIRRQAIAVLSDGRDTTSLLRSDDVLVLVAESGIGVYPIVLTQASEPGRMKDGDSLWVMKSIARDSGARAFVARDSTEFPAIYDAIANELAHQYVLGYYSINARRDGAFRRVDVRVVGRDEISARTRPGYFAPRR